MTSNAQVTQPTAVVIGAGVAGLATACLLRRDGYDVVVLERLGQVGGRAGVLEDEGFRWDMGPSWWLMPQAFAHFYELMGTSVEAELDLVPVNDPAFRLFTEGYPAIDVSTGSQNIYELFESLEPGSGETIQRYLEAFEVDYRLSVDQFLYTNFGELKGLMTPEILGRMGRLLRKLTRSLDADVASQFQHPQLRQLLTYAAVFLSSAPKATPAFYGIMNYTTMVEGVRYPMGGFSRFVASLHRLALQSGARVLTGADVQRIEYQPQTTGQSNRVGSVIYRDETGEHRVSADVVVSSADRQHTEAKLLPGKKSSRHRYWKRRNPGMSCVLVYLGIEGSLPQLPHHSLIFSKDWDPDFDAVFNQKAKNATSQDATAFSKSLYVCRPSATDPSVAPAGHENVFLLIPVPAVSNGIVGNLDHSPDPETTDIVDQALQLVGSRIGVADLAQRVVKQYTVGPGDFEERFNAWRGNALGLAHTLSQSAFFRGKNTARDVEGLYFAGATTTPGVGLPMCLISAENVVKSLRDDTSTGPLVPPLLPEATQPTNPQ